MRRLQLPGHALPFQKLFVVSRNIYIYIEGGGKLLKDIGGPFLV